MRRKPWTPEDDARLAAMRAKGYGFEAIELVVSHSADACKMRASILGVYKGAPDQESATTKGKRPAFHRDTHYSPKSEAKRCARQRIPCMNDRCKKLFVSDGPHNRLCPNCRRESLTVYDTPAQVLR